MSHGWLLGVLHTREEKWDDARYCCEHSYSIRVEVFGKKHIHAAESMCLFGAIMIQLNDLDLAEEYLKDALDIQQAVLGPFHTEVASTLSSLGLLEKRRGKLDSSQAYHERAKNIRAKLFGEQHPLTESSFATWARLISQLGTSPKHVRVLKRFFHLNSPVLEVTITLAFNKHWEYSRQ